jgi:ArsR family transcriptional regulator
MTDLSDRLFEIHAEFCSACSNPKRLKIMWLLGEETKSVGEIARDAGIPESSVSQHLRVLKDRGAVVSRKEGRVVCYSVANKNFLRGLTYIRKGLSEELEKMSKVMKT